MAKHFRILPVWMSFEDQREMILQIAEMFGYKTFPTGRGALLIYVKKSDRGFTRKTPYVDYRKKKREKQKL